MAVNLQYSDETGFVTSDYRYGSNETNAKKAYVEAVARAKDGKNDELHQSVALVVDGKVVEQYPAKKG